MNSNNREEIYENETMDSDESIELDNWELERHLLKQQIKELESALNKSKKFHQKFVDDVIQSEEIRNQEFEREKKELVAANKQQNAQIRALTKDKHFFETTCIALMKEKEMSSNRSNVEIQSTKLEIPLVPSERSTTRAPKLQTKSSGNDSKYKISTKLFHDNKKLKEKISKLTKSNASFRQQIKQLENFKKKIENKKEQQVADQHEMDNLLKSTTRTNSEIFNKAVLTKLDQFNRKPPNIDLL